MISVKCPHCQAGIRGDDGYAGRVIACPSCKKQVRLPVVAQPLPVKTTASHTTPPIRASRSQPDPSPIQEDEFSFLSGDTSSASSSSYSKSRSYVPKKKKKTDPMPYIVGGVVGLVAVVGIGLFASGVFQSDHKRTQDASSYKEIKKNASQDKASTNANSGEGTPEEAKKILCLILDSWVLGENAKEFKEQHPEIGYLTLNVSVRANKLLRYEINASKSSKKKMEFVNRTLELPQYTFAVTMVFVTVGGTEIKEPWTYSLYMLDGKWDCLQK